MLPDLGASAAAFSLGDICGVVGKGSSGRVFAARLQSAVKLCRAVDPLAQLQGCKFSTRMPTISELVDKSDIRVQGKDNVKRILHQLGYELEDAVGKAFLKITKKDMTDAGMSIAHANAILAEVEPVQGSPQRAYEPVEDEITLAGFVDMLLWHVWKCMDMYDQGPKLAVHGQVQYLLPQSLQALKNSIRCILHALEVLHQAGFAHTDLRWENIILQHAGQWVLIDLEFACVLNTVPFTPEGHDRKVLRHCIAGFSELLDHERTG
ncbi:hypothetical protein WJX82_004607 [Trebouxia sp. C0006]